MLICRSASHHVTILHYENPKKLDQMRFLRFMLYYKKGKWRKSLC